MKLWHRTDEAGRQGIVAGGFSQADPPLGPGWDSAERGRVWFAASKAIARQTCWRKGWWVVIEVPDNTPEYAFDDGTPFTGNFHLDIGMVKRSLDGVRGRRLTGWSRRVDGGDV